MSAGFDAIFFDNDGVLVDTEPLFLRATREAMERLGLGLGDDEYRQLSLVEGRSVFDLAKQRGVSSVVVEDTRVWRNGRYMALIREGVPVLPGAEACLTQLHGARPMAIVTSSYPDHFDAIHEQTGFLRFFEFALKSDEYGKHKPHPEPYLTAAERLDVDPKRCVAIEDTQRGLASAVAAGMQCVVVPTALSHADFSGAVAVLESLAELPGVLDGLVRS